MRLRPYVMEALEAVVNYTRIHATSPNDDAESFSVGCWNKIILAKIALGFDEEARGDLRAEFTRLAGWITKYPNLYFYYRLNALYQFVVLAASFSATGIENEVIPFLDAQQHRILLEQHGEERDYQLHTLAEIWMKFNRIDNAKMLIQNIDSPDHRATCVRFLAIHYAERGDIEEAKHLLNRVECDFDRGTGLIQLARTLLKTDRKRAESLLPEIVSLENSFMQFGNSSEHNRHYLKGNVDGLFAEFGDIDNVLLRFPKYDGWREWALSRTVEVLTEQGRVEEAYRVLKQIEDPSPLLRVRILLKEGQHGGGVSVLTSYWNELYKLPDSHGYKLMKLKDVALVLHAVGLTEQALQAFEDCYRLLAIAKVNNVDIGYEMNETGFDWRHVALDLVTIQAKTGLAFTD